MRTAKLSSAIFFGENYGVTDGRNKGKIKTLKKRVLMTRRLPAVSPKRALVAKDKAIVGQEIIQLRTEVWGDEAKSRLRE